MQSSRIKKFLNVVVLIASFLMLGVVIGIGWLNWNSYRDYQRITKQIIHIERMQANITWAQGQMLTVLSIKKPGYDPVWVERFNQAYEVWRNASNKLIVQSSQLGSVNKQAYLRMNRMNDNLVAHYHKFGRLIEHRQSVDKQLITSRLQLVKMQKQYDDLMRQLSNSLLSSSEISLIKIKQSINDKYLFGGYSLLLFALTSLSWMHFSSQRRKDAEADTRQVIRTSEDKYKKLACYDSLTKLANRFLFQDIITTEFEKAKRERKPLALMYIDIDNFKRINDTLGHEAGDVLLQLAAKRLKNAVREGDVVARLGGDEFGVIVANIRSEDETTEIANRILASFDYPFLLQGNEISSSPSIGISVYPDVANSVKSLVQNADMAMYRAKASGRNCFKYFTNEIYEQVKRTMTIEDELKQAIEKKEFRLVYQPQYDVLAKRVVGVEALIRWDNARLGKVPPMEFIPIAEETGLISDIGEWVINHACQQLAWWNRSDEKLMSEVHVSINASIIQFESGKISQQILMALNKSNLRCDSILLEITETALLKNYHAAQKALAELNEHGINVSLDDFGTGYSSISLLRNAAIKQIKIDSSFILDIQTNRDSERLVSGLVSLSRELDLSILAEGVENIEQVELLLKNGCGHVQGYHYSHPLEADELIAYIRKINLA